MRRYCWILICVAFAAQGATDAQTAPSRDIPSLMTELSDVRTIRRDTVEQILKLARNDPHAREYVVQKLPELIRRPQSDVWLDAIRIAGRLKSKGGHSRVARGDVAPSDPCGAKHHICGDHAARQ